MEEACKLMLKYLMIDELMTEHCYRGQSEKKAFTCYGSIINCMQGNPIRIGFEHFQFEKHELSEL